MGVIYDGIVARFAEDTSRAFKMHEEPGTSQAYDSVSTYTLPATIEFYGIPFGLSPEDRARIEDGDMSEAVPVATVSGWLILCREMQCDDYEPLEVCDDADGDLEYTISALQEEDGPLNEDGGDTMQEVFFIHEVSMKVHDDDLEKRILEELPYLIKDFMHVAPDILAYYPPPMKAERESQEEAHRLALRATAINQVARRLGVLLVLDGKERKTDEKILTFTGDYHFTEDEVKMVLGRRYSGSAYSEERKNRAEWRLFEDLGFQEAGDSRLLYKSLGRERDKQG